MTATKKITKGSTHSSTKSAVNDKTDDAPVADKDWPSKGGSSASAATPFVVFAIMYSVSFLYEMVEKWKDPTAAVFFLVFFAIMLATGVRLSVYMLFLASATAYEMIWCFPDVANHVNLAIFMNILQLAVGIHTFTSVRRQKGDVVSYSGPHAGTLIRRDFFIAMRPVMGVAVFFMYFFAGFHKLNHDFFNPQVSCTNRFMHKIMAFYKIPMFEPSPKFVQTMSVATVIWEVGGSFALFFRRTQPVMLLYSMMMHLILAPCSFYDFSSMVFACFTFYLPPSYWKIYNDEKDLSLPLGLKIISRHSLYAASTIMIGALTWFYQPKTPAQIGEVQFKAGQIFCGCFFLLAWPILRRLLSFFGRNNKLPPWQSSFHIWSSSIRPRWVVYPVYALLVVFGMSNYLGLRTAGTFSMFSNLKTEGPSSNHLLLGSNPIKFWNFQEDIVFINEAVVYKGTIDNRQTILKHVGFPLIEFQKKLLEWQEDSPYPIYMYFQYGQQCFESLDIAHDDYWLVKLGWLHYWLDFRMIQMDDEPNRCVW